MIVHTASEYACIFLFHIWKFRSLFINRALHIALSMFVCAGGSMKTLKSETPLKGYSI